MPAVTAVVLAKDEEIVIGRCLKSLAFLDEVVVVDSGSTDRTKEIARQHGATVLEQPWLGWSPQRMAGASAARNDWILVVESDEVITPQLRRSIESAMAGDPRPADAFSVDRRGDFLGVLLPNDARNSNIRSFVRLFHRRHSGYDPADRVHERVRYSGQVHPLDGILLHWRGDDLDRHVTVINRYAGDEADMLDDRDAPPSVTRLVLLPMARFTWLYVVKREYQLGTRGFVHSVLRAFADFLRQAKHWEKHRTVRTLHPPSDPAKDRP